MNVKTILSKSDRFELDRQISDAEKRTHVQIVLAVIGRCDSYAELPWKAFGLGAGLGGLLVCVLNLWWNYWISGTMVFIAVTATLSVGAAFALLAVLMPRFAKLFLSAHRAEAEVRQYAESLFLSRELFSTHDRTGVLLLVGLFERQVMILPDIGSRNRLPEKVLKQVIKAMTIQLRHKKIRQALEDGLNQITLVLEAGVSGKGTGTVENELPNEIIEEKGA